jgi:hypothetical protein
MLKVNKVQRQVAEGWYEQFDALHHIAKQHWTVAVRGWNVGYAVWTDTPDNVLRSTADLNRLVGLCVAAELRHPTAIEKHLKQIDSNRCPAAAAAEAIRLYIALHFPYSSDDAYKDAVSPAAIECIQNNAVGGVFTLGALRDYIPTRLVHYGLGPSDWGRIYEVERNLKQAELAADDKGTPAAIKTEDTQMPPYDNEVRKVKMPQNEKLTGFMNFWKDAAVEGAKDGASHAAVVAARDLVKDRLGSHYPKFLRASFVGGIIDDLEIPAVLSAAATLWPNLPQADKVRIVCGRAARMQFAIYTERLLGTLVKPIFGELASVFESVSLDAADVPQT